MEALGPFKGISRDFTRIMENQMKKKMDNEMETALYRVVYWGFIGMMEEKMDNYENWFYL